MSEVRVCRMAVAVLAIALAIPTARASARQVDIGPHGGNSWGPRLDSLSAGVATRGVWRGYDLGSPAVRGLVDFGIWGRPVTAAGDWGVSMLAQALVVPDPRASAASGGRLARTAAIARRLDSDRAVLSLVVEGYALPQDDVDGGGIEAGLRVDGVQIPWPLGETRPALDAAVLVDRGHFDGTHTEVGAMLPLPANIFRLASFIGARVRADDYSGSFEYRSFEASLGWNIDLGGDGFQSPFAGPWKFTMTGSLLKPHGTPVVGWLDLGVAYIY